MGHGELRQWIVLLADGTYISIVRNSNGNYTHIAIDVNGIGSDGYPNYNHGRDTPTEWRKHVDSIIIQLKGHGKIDE